MLEAAVRTASALWFARTPDVKAAVLEHVDRLQVVRRVGPGETLVVRSRMAGDDGQPGSAVFTALGVVGDEPAMRARFRLRALTSPD